MGDVLAVRERVLAPFAEGDVVALSDPWTVAYHRFVLEVLGSLAAAIALPSVLTLSDDGLWCGPVSWRHPAAEGGTPPGLCFRGIPLLPPEHVHRGAPWSHLVPTDGILVDGSTDLAQLGVLTQPAEPVGEPSAATASSQAGQTSRASTSSA
jgi:hypothetical protein